jgi:hypothetical protein
MKNIHLIPTEKPSRLRYNLSNVLVFTNESYRDYGKLDNQHIYITSDEEIKEGVEQWYLDKVLNEPYNSGGAQYSSKQDVIILTTDQDLIKDGVQVIDDEFLEWFVKNANESGVPFDRCEVEVEFIQTPDNLKDGFYYKIIIPQEEPKQDRTCTNNCSVVCGECQIFEPKQETLTYTESAKKEERIFNSTMMSKQETLEEAADKFSKELSQVVAFYEGARWQAERMYSKEEVIEFGEMIAWNMVGKTITESFIRTVSKELFEQFKKK